jgi:3-oxoacyl-[acyl-carrier protein] reductase
MDLKIKNKTALITGASTGLGFATAKLLAEEGAKIAINSRNPENLEKAAIIIRQSSGNEVLTLPGDLTSPETPANILEEINKKWGQLDLLVTNAGGPQPGQFENLSDENWYHAFELSFMSHIRLIRAALPLLRKSNTASVLTVTSLSVKQPIPNLVLSNSIRAATAGLTKTLALELGHENIRFNSILPGWTMTERVISLLENRALENQSSVEAEIAKQAAESPLGRLATPEEFANAAVFLLSPAASYFTGLMLSVDGGMYKGTL